MQNNIIEVKNLTKKYGDFTAVDNISFSVIQGEIFGILGPNGAGKTTTLEMIEGLKPLTGGEIILDGNDINQETARVKSKIGVQLQASSFFDGLNLIELLETYGSMYGRKVDSMELLEKVQLKEKAKSYAKELSGGQKQRLSIAVALVNDPKVVFLDEPTTGLDPQARRNLWDLISEIHEQGKTVVLTTHYMDEAEILCDRIAIMDRAKILKLDTTKNLLKNSSVNSSITFRFHGNLNTGELNNLPFAENVTKDGYEYRLTSKNSHKTLPALFTWADSKNMELLDLQMRQPTLEDVFLKLTGHGLRD